MMDVKFKNRAWDLDFTKGGTPTCVVRIFSEYFLYTEPGTQSLWRLFSE